MYVHLLEALHLVTEVEAAQAQQHPVMEAAERYYLLGRCQQSQQRVNILERCSIAACHQRYLVADRAETFLRWVNHTCLEIEQVAEKYNFLCRHRL